MENALKPYLYPTDVRKLSKLEVCSNILLDGCDLMSTGNIIPLVIGSGKVPKIWLMLKNNDVYRLVISGNISLDERIKVETNEHSRQVEVYAEDKKMINAKMISDDHCHVSFLNLRPVGLLVEGNKDHLEIAGINLTNNKISEASVAFRFGS